MFSLPWKYPRNLKTCHSSHPGLRPVTSHLVAMTISYTGFSSSTWFLQSVLTTVASIILLSESHIGSPLCSEPSNGSFYSEWKPKTSQSPATIAPLGSSSSLSSAAHGPPLENSWPIIQVAYHSLPSNQCLNVTFSNMPSQPSILKSPLPRVSYPPSNLYLFIFSSFLHYFPVAVTNDCKLGGSKQQK